MYKITQQHNSAAAHFNCTDSADSIYVQPIKHERSQIEHAGHEPSGQGICTDDLSCSLKHNYTLWSFLFIIWTRGASSITEDDSYQNDKPAVVQGRNSTQPLLFKYKLTTA